MSQKTAIISAKGTDITILENKNTSYLSLTDIARYKNPEEPKGVIANWMRLRDTIEFLGVWEQLHNPNFKGLEFEAFKNESGSNAFTLSPQKWIKSTNAIGVISKSGRYNGGTYAHSDIAFEFASWISPEFKLYIIKDYQRLKKEEASQSSIGWSEKRELSKLNYHIHTDAIQKYLINNDFDSEQKNYTFASEADMLNVALFGKKAWEWRNGHQEETKKGLNIRDFASAEELVVLINLESENAELIKAGLPQQERFIKLKEMARTQLAILVKNHASEKIRSVNPNLLIGGDKDAD